MSVRGTYVFEAEAGSGLLFANLRNPRQAPLVIPRHNCCRGVCLAALWERSAFDDRREVF
jgi:hypothetical protein